MDIVLNVTQYEGDTKTHSLRLSLNSYQPAPEQWTFVRWKIGQPKIPPVGEILTEEGWRPVLDPKYPIKYVNPEDIEKYL